MARLDIYRRICAMIQIFRQDITLFERFIVDVNDAAADFHDISRHSHNAFDIRLRRIQRIPKDYDIFALNSFDSIDELVYEDSFLIDKLRQHTRSFDLHRLIKEDHNQNGRADRKKNVTGPASDLGHDTGS